MTDRGTLSYVEGCMDNEGFHYCFTSYSYFDKVKDKKFHSLRLKYLEYSQLLEEYVRTNANIERVDNGTQKETRDSEDSSSGDDIDSSEDDLDSSDSSSSSNDSD